MSLKVFHRLHSLKQFWVKYRYQMEAQKMKAILHPILGIQDP